MLERSRVHPVKATQECGLTLRQNYNREGPRLALQVGRTAHAKQFKRMHGVVRTLRIRVGRVYRDIERQHAKVSSGQLPGLMEVMARIERILTQQRKDKNKLYALHAPEVECIAKGKAKIPYEFGVKVSIVTTLKEGLVVGARSMPGNPFDGYTLHDALEQAEIVSNVRPQMAFVIVATRAQRSTVFRFGDRVSDAV